MGLLEPDDEAGIRRGPARGGASRAQKVMLVLWSAFILIRERKRFDILHIMSFHRTTLVAILIGRLLGKKVAVSSVQNSVDDPVAIRRLRLGRLQERIFSLAHRFVVCSGGQAGSYRRCGYPPRKVVFIPNGFDPTILGSVTVEGRARVRAELGVDEDAVVFLMVGSASYRKGFDLMVEAAGQLHQAGAELFRVVLVGPRRLDENPETLKTQGGEGYLDEVGRRIRELGLEDHIKLAGRVPSIADYLAAADAYLLPSRHEGFPVSLLEAMAVGLPPLMWSLPDYDGYGIEPMKHAIQVPPFSCEALAEAMRGLIEDPVERRRVGVAARDLVVPRYSIEENLLAHDRLYSELAG